MSDWDEDTIDEILTRWGSKGTEERADAAYLRSAIKGLADDPMLTVLTKALDRQANSMDDLAKNVPVALEKLRSIVVRSFLVYGGLALILMAGLVGTQIIISDGELRVNDAQATSP